MLKAGAISEILAELAKWLSVRLPIRLLWIQILLHSLQIIFALGW